MSMLTPLQTDSGISQANKNSDKSSLHISYDISQKASHLKGVYSYEGPSCIPIGKPTSSAPFSFLKCFCINAHSMGNKQELEICMQLKGCDPIVITEAGWDNSHDWNSVMDCLVLFR